MEDLLELILGLLLEVVGEALCELILAESFGLTARLFRRVRVSIRRSNPVIATFTFILLGIGTGFLSALALPHPFVHLSKLHGISLLISPLISGLVLGYIGRVVHRRGQIPVRIESFRYGFIFAFAFSLVRFLLVH